MAKVIGRRGTKKRANGEGTITRRSDGRWQAAVYRPNGSRKFLYAATREEAHTKLVAAQKAIMDGLPLPDERITVGEFLKYWLDTLEKLGSVRRATWESYEGYVRLHLKPGLGRLSLAKLQPAQVQQFMTEKLDEGLSPNSVRYCRVVLRAALGQAMKLGLVPRNIAALTTAPKARKTAIAKPLTPEEAKKLVEGLSHDRFRELHILMLFLGLRQGEALGLRWTDLDLGHSVCHIGVQLTRRQGRYQLDELKTERSRRDLPLSDFLVHLLREHRALQNAERLAAKDWVNEWELVFTCRDGRPLHFSTVNHQFHRELERLDIEPRRHYDLRHTTASLLIDQGAELRDIMEQLGHSQIGLTANTYGHIFLDRKKKLARAMGDLLAPTPVVRPNR
jgi:integrase